MTLRPAVQGTALPHGAGRSRATVRPRELRLPLAVGAATLAGVLYLAVTDPYVPGGHPVCPLLLLTGFSCPACGAQRAVHSLAHGDLAAAWAMNPLLVALAPVAVVAWVRW